MNIQLFSTKAECYEQFISWREDSRNAGAINDLIIRTVVSPDAKTDVQYNDTSVIRGPAIMKAGRQKNLTNDAEYQNCGWRVPKILSQGASGKYDSNNKEREGELRK